MKKRGRLLPLGEAIVAAARAHARDQAAIVTVSATAASVGAKMLDRASALLDAAGVGAQGARAVNAAARAVVALREDVPERTAEPVHITIEDYTTGEHDEGPPEPEPVEVPTQH